MDIKDKVKSTLWESFVMNTSSILVLLLESLESFRLERALKKALKMKSNHQPNTSMSTAKPCPCVPKVRPFLIR